MHRQSGGRDGEVWRVGGVHREAREVVEQEEESTLVVAAGMHRLTKGSALHIATCCLATSQHMATHKHQVFTCASLATHMG